MESSNGYEIFNLLPLQYWSILLYLFLALLLVNKIYQVITFNEIVVDLSDTKWNHKYFDLKNVYKLEELPPFYPNGWLSVLESYKLKRNQIKPVFAFGYDLVVFRGSSGNVYVADAYCPHLGANIGVGGMVVGESIKCPFHGWTFDSTGVCTHVPEIESSNLPKVRIKIWDSIEVNGFIFVWHHSNGIKPQWFPIKVNEIETSKLVYMGRADHIVNCHFQEIPENGADVMHLNELHSGPEFLGNVLNRTKYYDLIIKYLFYKWKAKWEPCPPPDQHIAHMNLEGSYYLFGYPLIKLEGLVQQIGPANVHLYLHIKVAVLGQINCIIIQTITSLAQMKHRIIHHFYCEPTIKAFLFSKFIIYGEAKMVNRDIVIWNNKKFLKRPHFAKNERPLQQYRRWFNQFYTEKCPSTF